MPGRSAGGGVAGGRPAMMSGAGEGVLAFEKPGGGSDLVDGVEGGGGAGRGQSAGGGVERVPVRRGRQGTGSLRRHRAAEGGVRGGGGDGLQRVRGRRGGVHGRVLRDPCSPGPPSGRRSPPGGRRLSGHDGRPSPKGDMPLADWLVPVHYLRKDVSFPQARTDPPCRRAVAGCGAGPDPRRTNRARTRAGPAGRGGRNCSWAAMTWSTSWRWRRGCSVWWCCLVRGGRGRVSWRRGSPGGSGTPAGWMTRGWCCGIRSSPASRPSGWTG